MEKILWNYPFKNLGIRLAEGFSAYDGALGDQPGREHRGIDFVLQLRGRFIPFEVFSMHEGEVFTGSSRSWGNFVILRSRPARGIRRDTVYAHVDSVPLSVPMLPKAAAGDTGRELKGLLVPAGFKLGVSGTSGDTHGIVQLHIELHEKNIRTGARKKLDPYGIYDRASSGRYRQPGESLAGLDHSWISDEPAFV